MHFSLKPGFQSILFYFILFNFILFYFIENRNYANLKYTLINLNGYHSIKTYIKAKNVCIDVLLFYCKFIKCCPSTKKNSLVTLTLVMQTNECHNGSGTRYTIDFTILILMFACVHIYICVCLFVR